MVAPRVVPVCTKFPVLCCWYYRLSFQLLQKCDAVEEEFSNRNMKKKKRKYGNKESNPLKFKISRIPHLQLSLNKESLFGIGVLVPKTFSFLGVFLLFDTRGV